MRKLKLHTSQYCIYVGNTEKAIILNTINSRETLIQGSKVDILIDINGGQI
jgi:hypothetical protein